MMIRKPILFLASIVGIVDSYYLTDQHFTAGGACNTDFKEFLGYPIDCGYIDSSKYSEVFSIPLALLGLLYYLSIFFILYFDNWFDMKLAQLKIHENVKSHLDLVIIMSAMGILYTFYLMYIQFVVLEIVCIYCLYSALSTATIFGVSISYKFKTS